nr:uncharacterized protein LOC123774988 [Procambarus clarkii]
MVTGTSSVTIHVGLNGGALAAPVVVSSSNLPSSVPSPISSRSQNPAFKSVSFLSSAYNQQSFKYKQSSFENSNADIERVSKNIAKGPKDCLSKLGSVKFAKKSRKPLPPSVVNSGKKEYLVTKLSPPTPKPRTHVPKTEINESLHFSPSHRRARTELKLDLKPVFDDSHLPKDRLKCQPEPDIVSTTRDDNLVMPINDSSGKNGINKPTLRVKKLISLHSSSESQLRITDNHVCKDGQRKLGKLSERPLPEAPSFISGLKLHPSNPVSSANPKVVTMCDCNISSLPSLVSSNPVSFAQKSKSRQPVAGNPLHSKLIGKFGNSPITVEDVPHLHKVLRAYESSSLGCRASKHL